MKDVHSYEELVQSTYRALLVDCAREYPELSREFDRDSLRLDSALDRNGLKFFLETLPNFRKHFDKCLAEERLSPSNLVHFGCEKKTSSVPRLFKGLILRVFQRDGQMVPSPDSRAVFLIRQLCSMVKKLQLSCPDSALFKAVSEFVSDEQLIPRPSDFWSGGAELLPSSSMDFFECSAEVRSQRSAELFPTYDEEHLDRIQQTADLVTGTLGFFDPYVWKPRHGPGAVSDQRFGAYKYAFKTWPDRLDEVFPWEDFAFANNSHVPFIVKGTPAWDMIQQNLSSKLIAVPKTISTPRLIASEPTSNQWCQQIMKDFFYTRVKDTFVGRFISFDNQTFNGELAREASIDGAYATIDLSRASDMISCYAVEALFRRSPSILMALRSCRTTVIRQEIDKKHPKIINLRKFSTMGNATTFPVQSLLFLSIALGSLLYKKGLPATYESIKMLGKLQVRVFGDDIIVPNIAFRATVDALSSLGLRVNTSKTFSEGNFRESCGVDAFRGDDVTPVSILTAPSRTRPGSIVSAVDVVTNLAEAGLLATATSLRKIAAKLVQNKVPVVRHRSGVFGWSDLTDGDEPCVKTRFNRNLQITEIKCLSTQVQETRSLPECSAGLLQYFIEAPKRVTSAVSSLGYLVQRPKAKLSLRWVPMRP